jgi:hypothetical protein
MRFGFLKKNVVPNGADLTNHLKGSGNHGVLGTYGWGKGLIRSDQPPLGSCGSGRVRPAIAWKRSRGMQARGAGVAVEMGCGFKLEVPRLGFLL